MTNHRDLFFSLELYNSIGSWGSQTSFLGSDTGCHNSKKIFLWLQTKVISAFGQESHMHVYVHEHPQYVAYDSENRDPNNKCRKKKDLTQVSLKYMDDILLFLWLFKYASGI